MLGTRPHHWHASDGMNLNLKLVTVVWKNKIWLHHWHRENGPFFSTSNVFSLMQNNNLESTLHFPRPRVLRKDADAEIVYKFKISNSDSVDKQIITADSPASFGALTLKVYVSWATWRPRVWLVQTLYFLLKSSPSTSTFWESKGIGG